MRLSVEGKEVAKTKAPSLFKQPLTQGVRVSQDFNSEDRMGDYEGNYFLTGNMQSGTMELKRPSKTSSTPVAMDAVGKTNTTGKTSTAKNIAPITINMSVVPNVMKYNKTLITVKAGQKVTINLDNPDGMQHNMVIIKPGTTQKVGAAADALAANPKGADLQYVPRMPEVLNFIKLLLPGEEGTMVFTAPTTPGDYPFICTFPGHWRIMNGIIRVTK